MSPVRGKPPEKCRKCGRKFNAQDQRIIDIVFHSEDARCVCGPCANDESPTSWDYPPINPEHKDRCWEYDKDEDLQLVVLTRRACKTCRIDCEHLPEL